MNWRLFGGMVSRKVVWRIFLVALAMETMLLSTAGYGSLTATELPGRIWSQAKAVLITLRDGNPDSVTAKAPLLPEGKTVPLFTDARIKPMLYIVASPDGYQVSDYPGVSFTGPMCCTLDVSVSPAGGGSVIPGSGRYESGTQVTLWAIPGRGYRFVSWEGDVSSVLPVITLTLNSNMSVTAVFRESNTSGASGGEYKVSTGVTVLGTVPTP